MADVTTLLASAIQKSNEVIDLVKGKFGEWDKNIKDRLGWVTSETKSLISTAHNSTTFKIEGNNNIFYPVLIDTSYQPFSFFITRDSVHNDRTLDGRCIIKVEGFTSHWGHGASFVKITTNNHSRKRYLARAYEKFETGWVVLYLRGDTTYRFINSWGTAKLKDFTINSKRFNYKEEWTEFRPVEDGKNKTYQEQLKKNWILDSNRFSCPCVYRKSNGYIIDTNKIL